MRSLVLPYRRLLKETYTIEVVYSASSATTSKYYDLNIISFAKALSVVRLHDTWARFCREIFIMSAIGKARDLTGNIIVGVPGAANSSDVLNILWRIHPRRSNRPRSSYWEPKWYNPTEFIRLAQYVGLSNFPTLSAAIGATPSPIDDLRKIRNFLVHRSESAARDAKMVVGNMSPMEYLEQIVSPGFPLFITWIYQLRAQCQAAVT